MDEQLDVFEIRQRIISAVVMLDVQLDAHVREDVLEIDVFDLD